MSGKKPLIVLTGPTAVGKTKLSIALAKAIGGEIISADSMQVYKYMNIGSAKIKPEEMQGVPHYMIDCLEPTEDFNVAIFQKSAKEYMDVIYSHGNIPIMVGGTGFYIQAVLYDIDFTSNDEDMSYRMSLEELVRINGTAYLHEMLKKVDPESAMLIHENNVKRVIRALEFYKKTGTKISLHNEEEHQKESPYTFQYFVLTDKREIIYNNIEKRVDMMVKEGLVHEVQVLKDMGCKKESVAMQGLGYKEILSYLDGKCTLEEAVYHIKQNTRHFAKRQLTWFRREREVTWIEKEQYHYDNQKILQSMVAQIQKRSAD